MSDLETNLGALEAILMISPQPLSTAELANALGINENLVEDLLTRLQREYLGKADALSGQPCRTRGYELRHVGGGWRIYSAAAYADLLGGWVVNGQTSKLTTAALETLAVIAYREPVSRAKISAIRGVSCDSVIRTLSARGLIEECGTEAETGAILYRTTNYFLERLGLNSLNELPDLAPYLPTSEMLDDIEEELL